MDGTYSDQIYANYHAGTSSNLITYQAQNKGLAIVTGGFLIDRAYIDSSWTHPEYIKVDGVKVTAGNIVIKELIIEKANRLQLQ